MTSESKLKWLILPVLVSILTMLQGTACHAATFQSLRDARDAAWITYNKDDVSSGDTLEEGLEVNGAVDKNGSAKVNIENWEEKAIPRKNEELIVYTAEGGARIAGKVYGDTIMSVIYTEGDWTKIQSGFLQGYVKSDKICYNEEAKKRADKICPEQIISDIGDTRIFQQPDRGSNILEYMGQRITYNIVGVIPGWFSVWTAEGVAGYIAEEDVQKVRTIHLGRTIMDIDSPQKPYIKEMISAQDRRLLAAMIYCEARGEVFQGQIAVASVIMNRVHSDLFPDTVSEVVYQDGQFEPVLMDRYERVLEDDSQITVSCYEAADVVIQGGNNVSEALFFKIGGEGQQIGSHRFY